MTRDDRLNIIRDEVGKQADTSSQPAVERVDYGSDTKYPAGTAHICFTDGVHGVVGLLESDAEHDIRVKVHSLFVIRRKRPEATLSVLRGLLSGWRDGVWFEEAPRARQKREAEAAAAAKAKALAEAEKAEKAAKEAAPSV